MTMNKPYWFRMDTEQEPKTDQVVEENRQQFIGCLAMRGEGKSYLLESYAEEAYLKGYTILDLHGADNLENAFWVFPSEDPECENPIRIPITLIAQESIIYDQKEVDFFNSRQMTEQEWYEQFPYAINHMIFNSVYPPRIPFKKKLLEIETIPPVTNSKAEYETEANQKALDKLVKIILNCTANGRIFVLNRMMFASERQYFWTLELIVRNLVGIADKYYLRLEPEDVGLPKGTPRKFMRPRKRNHHRIMVVTRELGEICPSRSIKGDKTGESLSVKKAFFNFIRKARHPQIDWIADWQRNNDVEDAIRSQADKWVFKRYNDDLGGDDKKNFFDLLKNIRHAVVEKYGKVKGEIINRSNYPRIEKLDQKYHYLWISGEIHLKRVRKCRHLHKEPWHRFWQKSGIHFDHDYTKVKEEKEVGKAKSKDQDVALIYTIVRDLKDPEKQKRRLNNEQILKRLATMQTEGKINYHLDFQTMSSERLSTYYPRWKKTYDNLNTQTKPISQ